VAMLTKLVGELEHHLSKIAEDVGLPAQTLVASLPPSSQPMLNLNLTE
jgi:hypothetical protein